MQDDLESKTAATQREFRDQHMQLSQRLSVAIQRLALYEVKSGERYDLLKNTLLELALKLVRKKVVAGLGPDPSIPDLLTQLDVQRTESTDQLLRLEQDIEGLSGSYEQLHGSVQALVTRSNHWAALDVRLQEYHESLVKHCRHIFARSSLSSYGPDQVLQLQGRGLLLKKETVDLIASHSYRIAKTIALKADYDIIRHNVESKDTLTDNQCDAKILQSRETYLMRFLGGVKRAVEVGLDGEGRASGITEIITQFHSKLEQAIRLALSKFSRIHTGRSLFGKISLEAEAACLACNRQFPEEPGQGDRRASFRKSVTGSNSINAISGSNGISQRGSIYRQNRNSFKTFSSSKEASFLENAIKEQRGRRSDARENVVSTARASTPANRQGRRATSYSLGTATIIS
ncbi:hypothetical protein Naga_100020g29 [Nannochloropsis gaditana]|uniref:Uncharacterized protein n=1 Tax=Nannochloropsis gaditana TaxID=72520 RepID=W7TB27_9STRA|nr:hypothetical protein Naga_100020g29 [Nannochloropsis gaditana]